MGGDVVRTLGCATACDTKRHGWQKSVKSRRRHQHDTYDSSNNEPRPAVLLRKPQQLALAPAQSAIFIQKTCIPWWWRLLLLLLLLLFLLAFSHSSIGHFRASSWASARLRRLARAPNYYRSLENNKWTMATMIFLFLSFFFAWCTNSSWKWKEKEKKK